MSHGTHINESCHTYEWVMAHIRVPWHISNINFSVTDLWHVVHLKNTRQRGSSTLYLGIGYTLDRSTLYRSTIYHSSPHQGSSHMSHSSRWYVVHLTWVYRYRVLHIGCYCLDMGYEWVMSHVVHLMWVYRYRVLRYRVLLPWYGVLLPRLRCYCLLYA